MMKKQPQTTQKHKVVFLVAAFEEPIDRSES